MGELHAWIPAAPIDAIEAEALALELFVAGYDGTSLPATYRRRLEAGMAGVILFSRNLLIDGGAIDLDVLCACTAEIAATAGELPKVCAVDQEGGPVARLRAPFTSLPAMQIIGDHDDPTLAKDCGALTGRECLAAGFNIDFAPVLDIDTNPDNPIIATRAFGRDPERVARLAGAFLEGLHSEGVLGCGKHFPGHGDTDTDSHLELPVLRHDLARLEAIELAPFAALAHRMELVMTAHVLFPALDEDLPATLSAPILQGLLRGHCDFSGVIVSDDLEMRGVAAAFSTAECVRRGLAAGIDLFLVCHREDALDEAVATAAKVIRDGGDEASGALEAVGRVRRMRSRLRRPAPTSTAVRRAIDDPRAAILRDRLGIGTV